MLYVTPDGYLARGMGSASMETSDLRALLNRASRAADSYCSVPALPQRYSFRGGTIIGEQHDYHLNDGVFQMAQRQIFLRHTPLISVEQLRIYVTNTQYVEFAPSELFVSENDVQIVSLAMTSVGLFGAAIVPIIGLGTPKIRANYTYGYRFPVVDEELDPTDGQLYRAANQFWLAGGDVTVTVDGVTSDPGDYTVDEVEGTITFTGNQAADTIVRASYTHTMPSEIAEAVSWIAADMSGERDLTSGGLGGLRSLKVGEISVERNVPRNSTAGRASTDIPDRAARLLDGFSFISQ